MTINPTLYRRRETKKRICVVDTETDPFKEGRPVKPFCLGFHDTSDGTYIAFWGDDCVTQFFTWFREAYRGVACIVYAHNAGKFDFYFFLDFMDMGQYPSIINGRIVAVLFDGQEFRDSFAIIPEKLSSYQKDEISYAKFERPVREANKVEILAYLKSDCIYLGELVGAFHVMFGDRLTIGSTALPMLKSFHGFETLAPQTDAFFRRFYFGGRVECFEQGNLKGDWKVYDVNSMYPYVMASRCHPIGRDFVVRDTLKKGYHFAHVIAENRGALPHRAEDGSLNFDHERGEFFATSHEIDAGITTGRLRIISVKAAYRFLRETSFAEFVEHFYTLRLEAKRKGDKILNIFYKLILNSAYGKFAQDPSSYCDFAITRGDLPDDDRGLLSERDNPNGWNIDAYYGNATIWKAKADDKRGFKNVATAASITGAARAELLLGIAAAKRPIYCDTDSLICENLKADLDPSRLGAWKLESEGDRVSIAGKKLYAVYSADKELKVASKGVKFTGGEIDRVAMGETVTHVATVPQFKRDGSQKFVDRDIKRTAKKAKIKWSVSA